MPVLGSGQNQRTSGSVIRYGGAQPYPCPAQLRPLIAPQLAEVVAYQVINTANTTVEYQGFGVYRITKSGGIHNNPDANVTSAALTGDFVLRVRLLDTISWIDFGVSAVPAAGPSYVNIDRSLHVNAGDALYGYEDGVYAGAFVPLAVDTFYFMRRVGSTITVLSGPSPNVADATLFDTLTDLGGTIYLDIGLVTAGATADVLLSVPVVDAITGSLSFLLTPAATISGIGALSGSSSLVLTPSAAVSGKGALVGSATVVFSPSGTVTGKGALAGASSLAFAPSGAIVGVGALAGASSLAFSADANVIGSGALSGSAGIAFSTSGVVSATGLLSGSANMVFATVGNLESAAPLGGISGSTSLGFTLTGTLIDLQWFVRIAGPDPADIVPASLPTVETIARSPKPAAVTIIEEVEPPLVVLG